MPQTFSSNPKFELLKDLKIGVLLGGNSSERKISLRSGRAVHYALKEGGFRPIRLDTRDSRRTSRTLSKIDLAFIALHGKGGEDGTVQSFLERRKIPYVGSDAAGSRNAFDKVVAKKIFIKKGILTPPFVILTSSSSGKIPFSGPYFVKPVSDGSSIGVFEVEDLENSAEKLTQALKTYGELLIEKKISGREFTVGILGQKALPVVELKPKRAFYDYRAKYTKGMTEYLVPAPIGSKLKSKLQKLALRVHRSLGLRDFSRVDIMADEKGRPYVLEANSIPGFTEFSLLPKAARAAGISFEQLCSRLVLTAAQRASLYKKGKHSYNGKKKT